MATRRPLALLWMPLVPAPLPGGCSAPAPASPSPTHPTPTLQVAVTGRRAAPAATTEPASTPATGEQMPMPALTGQPTFASPAQTAAQQAAQGSTSSGAPVDVIWNAEEKQLQQAHRAVEILTIR